MRRWPYEYSITFHDKNCFDLQYLKIFMPKALHMHNLKGYNWIIFEIHSLMTSLIEVLPNLYISS